MNLIIGAHLSEPPSEIYSFRDVTLYAKTFVFEDVLIKCPKGTRALYWSWLKRYGAHDYISYLLNYNEEESGITIFSKNSDFNIDRIDSFNLPFIISFLRSFSGG